MRLTAPRPSTEPEVDAAPVPAAWTPIGTVGSPFLGRVDGSGLVAPADAGWHLEWWVGAEDRWYLAGEERAVRQGLIDASPVVETWMRIPSGDAVTRVWAVPGDGGPVVAVEVENVSPVPVAVALAIVPGGIGAGASPGSAAGPGRIELVGREVLLDGEVALVLPKEPNRAVGSAAGAADLQSLVTGGDATGPALQPVVSAESTAAVALVVPLPHTARVRVLLPLGGAVVRGEGADADAVARGWAAQTEQGTRLELPDERLAQAATAARRQLLLWAQASGDLPFVAAAEVAGALARWGMGEEAAAVLAELTDRSEAARRLSRRSKDPAARGAWVDAVERVRDAVGDEALAERLGGAPRGTTPTGPRTPSGDVRDVLVLLGSASPTWAWGRAGEGRADADPRVTAAFLALVCDSVVQEADAGLRLLPHVPNTWLGQGIEVHDLPTRHGALSFAVRWHGERPALLWDLVPLATGSALTLTLPGLDPAWSTTELRGEALLAAPAAGSTSDPSPGAQPLDPGASFS